ncbi:triple tyrosine motif-containing protein [Cytophagales bacterium LB-30]|uniref:Triple tyrosine motif-containing protein n=1 Tax=Shiella aurantiaca TaxID=3058365 RepID=A0ABT8F720_9BACT|nr:triple tyrosine motif-containing protein [Shiella aurantiaca]MDN4166001.1 triple tyrosine motif-containing protein [Shiella aurantiaca]
MNYYPKMSGAILGVLLVLFFHLSTQAQKGQLYLTHFKPEGVLAESNVYAISQGQFGQMFFAARNGLIVYNGESWQPLKTTGTPYALQYDSLTEVLWIGGKNTFGKLQRAFNGQYSYQELFTIHEVTTEFQQVLVDDSTVYFFSEPLVISVDRFSQQITDTLIAEDGYFRHLFSHLGKRYLVTQSNTLLEWNADDTLVPSSLNGFPVEETVVGTFKQNGQTFLYTGSGQILALEGNTWVPWQYEGIDYVKESFIVSALPVGKDLLAIATLTGGCVLLHTESKKVERYINYNNGLPDDEVVSLGVDNQDGLWMAHDYGLSRAELGLSMRNFVFYPGISGNILSVTKYNNQLYVGTSEGLFYLEEVKDYDELEVILNKAQKQHVEDKKTSPVRRNIFQRKEESVSTETLTVKTDSPEEEGKKEDKKRLLSLFKKDKGKDKKDTPATLEPKVEEEPQLSVKEPVKTEKPVVNPKPPVKYIQEVKKVFRLRSIKYQYTKVKDMDAKCEQLRVIDGALWAETNLGLYRIEKGAAKQMLNVRDIFAFYPSEDNATILVAAGSGIYQLNKQNGKWTKADGLQGLNMPIYSMAKTSGDTYWFASDNRIGSFDLLQGNISNLQLLDIENPFSDLIEVVSIRDTIRFFLSSQVYKWEPTLKKLVSDDSFISIWKDKPRLIRDGNGHWVVTDRGYYRLGDSILPHQQAILRLFSQANSIFTDDTENIWVIDNNESVYQIPKDASVKDEVLSVYVTSVQSLAGNPLSLQNLTLEHDQNGISFYFASPFYLAEGGVEYSYYINGLMDDWSTWSGKSEVSFPYLPTGEYTLQVKARNLFGEEIESQSFYYSVKPPYWNTWWFHMGEFFFFATLIVISIWLNNTSQQTFITKSLTLLTLIGLVELLQNLLRYYLQTDLMNTPVYDFALDVLLAMSIYPLERVMNNILVNKNLSKTKNLIKLMRVPQEKKHDPYKLN